MRYLDGLIHAHFSPHIVVALLAFNLRCLYRLAFLSSQCLHGLYISGVSGKHMDDRSGVHHGQQ